MSNSEILRDKRVLILILFVALSLSLIGVKHLAMGWEISGGSELKVQTEYPMPYILPDGTKVTMQMLVQIITKRINGIGVKDVTITPWGSRYLLMDFAGTNPENARKIIEKQGKLVVKIGNVTAFTGNELTRISPYTKGLRSGSWEVPFTISQTAAERFRKASVETNFSKVYMYLDNKLVNSAPIGASLRRELIQGKTVRDLVLTTGLTPKDEAKAKNVEIILRSGALPIKLTVLSVSSVPPELGHTFGKNAAIAGFLAILTVALIIFIRYRVPEIIIPIMITGISEVIIILGFAALIRWQLDLPSIAGIIAAVGTGVDDQIVITDEVLMEKKRSIKQRIKSAFFIIYSSWFATIAAMLPLFVIGLSALRGFALTTIVGVTVGVFITRPAYGRIVEHYAGRAKRRVTKR